MAPKGEHLQRAPSPSAASSPANKTGPGVRRPFDAATRAAMLEREPSFWLAMRFEPSVSSGAWVIGSLAFVGPVAAIVTGHWETLFNPGMALTSFFLLNAALKTHAANLASRALARGQAEDPLEILLSTPMKSKGVILGQGLTFREALKPIVRHVLWIESAWLFLTITFLKLEDPGAPIAFYVLASFAVVGFLVPDLRAIGWTALWRGVAARSARDAEQEAFSLVAMLLWLPVFLSWMIATAVLNDREAGMVVPVLTWMVFSAWVDYWSSRRSQRLLEMRMHLWAQRRAAGELDHYDGWRAAGRWLGQRWRTGFYPRQLKSG
jgi:hypothetical protein